MIMSKLLTIKAKKLQMKNKMTTPIIIMITLNDVQDDRSIRAKKNLALLTLLNDLARNGRQTATKRSNEMKMVVQTEQL
uniref:Uncharacterized protein n=1 Tax=Romanomermis culicivorax TaxID=13658 RepID=A0A915IQU2_ROMCU